MKLFKRCAPFGGPCLALAASLVLAACSSVNLAFIPVAATIPAGVQTALTMQAYDSLEGGPCAVSADGVVWYGLHAGRFAPLWAAFAHCSSPATLRSNLPVPPPQWSVPRHPTRAIFAAVSLQEQFGGEGMDTIETIAAAHHAPVTWLVGNAAFLLTGAAAYDRFHASNGDDVQTELNPAISSAAARLFSWYTPAVAVLGAGAERNIAGAAALGSFWGITWNSRGTDRTFDQGSPWGTYCADALSYKRPDPAGRCTFVGVEWTARDLTRAYYSGREDAFSTVPEDLLQRAGFSAQSAGPYVRALIDAYAAAGEDQPLVVVAEEESANVTGDGDRAVLDALYGEAEATGMQRLTLRDAVAAARAFSAHPRAVAFPYIDAQNPALMPARIVGGTIDFHDTAVGMTFEAGRSTPARVFPYARDPASRYNVELARLQPAEMPRLTLAGAAGGVLALHIESPVATPYGIAIWSDARALGLTGAGVYPAGAAGTVLRFDVPQGASDHTFACAACTAAAFDYAR